MEDNLGAVQAELFGIVQRWRNEIPQDLEEIKDDILKKREAKAEDKISSKLSKMSAPADVKQCGVCFGTDNLI